jgi:organic radical activating enzyme
MRPILKYKDYSIITQKCFEIEMSSGCTRKCLFCYPGVNKERRNNPVYLDENRYEEVINEIYTFPENEKRWIEYAGHGEPLSHPQIKEMLLYTRKTLPKINLFIITNGDLLTEELCFLFKEIHVEQILLDYYGKLNNIDPKEKILNMIKKSGFNLRNFYFMDHTKRKSSKYRSRCSNLFIPKDLEKYRNIKCYRPYDFLFLSAEGEWVLCGEDLKHEKKWSKNLSIYELNLNEEFCKIKNELILGNRDICSMCLKCDNCEKSLQESKWLTPKKEK